MSGTWNLLTATGIQNWGEYVKERQLLMPLTLMTVTLKLQLQVHVGLSHKVNTKYLLTIF